MAFAWDVIIVAANYPQEEEYWQQRLKSCGHPSIVLTVAEDWQGSAGNGLGTLYALEKAQEKGKFKHRIDLFQMLIEGASIALFHAAGLGKKLFPLTAGENNCLSRIRLPGSFELLEMAIQQTAPLAKERKGRLSVFWGNHLLIPEATSTPHHHIELFYQQNEPMGPFSLSPSMCFALMREFALEIQEKKECLAAHQHFWLPLTLEKEVYLKRFPGSARHYKRMRFFREKFCALHATHSLITMTEMHAAQSWDFSSAAAYYHEVLKLASPTNEGMRMRLLFGIQSNPTGNLRVIKDEGSCLIDCKIGAGKILNSVLVGVEADSIEVKDSVIIHSRFSTLKSEKSLLYKVKEEHSLKLASGTIRADALLPETGEYLKIYSHLNRNGKGDWEQTLPSNLLSYQEIFQKIERQRQDICPASFV